MKAPAPKPADRAKTGWKWSLLTDRVTSNRLAQIDLAVGLILTVRPIKWADPR